MRADELERFDDAVAVFKRAVDLNPDDHLARTYFNFRTGRIAEGFDAASKASEAGTADLDLLKLSTSMRVNYARTAGVKLDDVIADLKVATEKHPRDEDLWFLLAAAHRVEKNENARLAAFQKAVEANPNSDMA